MHAQTHIIGKQIVKMEIDSTLDAFAIQQDVGWILKERIFPRLEKLFDELAPPGVYVRIDKLEISVGDLHPEKLESQLTAKVLEAVRASIRGEKTFTDQSPSIAISRLRPELAQLQAFAHFLRYGHLPWWTKRTAEDNWEESIILALKIAKTEDIGGLRSVLRTKVARQRLFWQFSEPLWETLALVLEPALRSALEPLKKILLHKLPEKLRSRLLTTVWTQQEFWLVVYDQLHAYSGTYQLEEHILRKYIDKSFQAFAKAETVLSATFSALRKEIPEILDAEKYEIVQQILSESQNLRQLQETSKFVEPSTPDPGAKIFKETLSEKDLESIQPLESASRAEGDASFEEGVFIQNAGLIILHPFLAPLFAELGYTENGQFKNEESQYRAVHLTQYLARGAMDEAEYELMLNKLLCGMPLNAPLPRNIDLSDTEKTEADHLLEVVIGHWTALRNTSPDGLRFNYFMREGKLIQKHASWQLQVEAKTHDILLNKLPWGIGMIQLSWMPDRMTVEWAY